MRYLVFILLLLGGFDLSAQIVKTSGIPYTATTPAHTPSASGSAWALDTANLDLYVYYAGGWNLAGERIQSIVGCVAPAYTPGKGQSLFVINACDSLYYYRSGAWALINKYTAGADTSGYNTSLTYSGDTLRLTDGNGTLSVVIVGGDNSSTNEGLLDVAAGGANSSAITSNTAGSPAVTISGGIGITVSEVADTITVTNSAPDQTVSITNGGGITVTGTYPAFTLTAADQSATNEIQTVDTFDISSNTLRVSLSSDGQAAKTVNLAPYLDNTDNQTLSIDSAIVGSNERFALSISNGNTVNFDVPQSTPPGGSDTHIQFNDGGSAFGGDADFTWNKTSNTATINGTLAYSDTSTTRHFITLKGSRFFSSVDNAAQNSQIDEFNLSLGYNAGADTMTGSANVLIGNNVGRIISSGGYNVGVGYRVLYNVTSGGYNVAIGSQAMQAGIITGNNNVGIGQSALRNITSASGNVAIGNGAGNSISTGATNTMIGSAAMTTVNSASYDNVAIGSGSLNQTTTARVLEGNTAIGISSGGSLTASTYGSTYIGANAGQSSSGNYGVYIGKHAGTGRTGSNKLYISTTSGTSYVTPLISGNFSTPRAGINIDPDSLQRTFDVNGEVRIRDLQTDNPTRLVGADADGDLNRVILGSNLTMSGDTLNASAGSGNTNLSFSGASSPVTLNSSTGNDVRFVAGSNITLSSGADSIIITSTGGAGMASWTLAGTSGTPETISDGDTATIAAGTGIITTAGATRTVTITADTTVIATLNDLENIRDTTLYATTHTASKYQIALINSSAAARTVNPPSSPATGDWFAVSDARAASGTNNITIDFISASQNLYGSSQNYILNTNGAYVKFMYVNANTGWVATKG